MICQMPIPQARMAVISPSDERRPNTSRLLVNALNGNENANAPGRPITTTLKIGCQATPLAIRSVALNKIPIHITKVKTSRVTRNVITKLDTIYLWIVRKIQRPEGYFMSAVISSSTAISASALTPSSPWRI